MFEHLVLRFFHHYDMRFKNISNNKYEEADWALNVSSAMVCSLLVQHSSISTDSGEFWSLREHTTAQSTVFERSRLHWRTETLQICQSETSMAEKL